MPRAQRCAARKKKKKKVEILEDRKNCDDQAQTDLEGAGTGPLLLLLGNLCSSACGCLSLLLPFCAVEPFMG